MGGIHPVYTTLGIPPCVHLSHPGYTTVCTPLIPGGLGRYETRSIRVYLRVEVGMRRILSLFYFRVEVGIRRVLSFSSLGLRSV